MSREKIANVLRESRIKKGLKASTVGEMIGKSGKTVSGWEHGNGQPDIDALMKLCALYGIESFDLFRDEESPTALNQDSIDVANAYQNAGVPVQSAIRRFLGLETR